MPRVTILRIEPAGYMLALTRALAEAWPGPLDIVYASRALTQPWDSSGADQPFRVLPQGRLRSMRAVREHIAAAKPDLLHVAGWSAPPALAAILTGHARRLPVVADLDTWRGTPSVWREPVKRVLYPRLFRLISHFAPGGQQQAAYLRGFGVPAGKITPVNMTVDVTAIQAALGREPNARQVFRDRFEIPLETTLALFMGRLVALKGIEDLLSAWPKVRAASSGAKLLIAGDGPLRPMVTAAADADASIVPVGRLSGADVWRAYAAADYAVASSHREGWGLIVNEAMAAGVPAVVTSAYGCVGDLARDGETALVVPPSSPEKLAEAMLRLTNRPALRMRLSATGSTLISGWTIEAQAQKITGIWEQVLAAKSRRPIPGYQEA